MAVGNRKVQDVSNVGDVFFCAVQGALDKTTK